MAILSRLQVHKWASRSSGLEDNLASSTVKNIFTLLSGNVMARAVAFLLTPLIARLYTPEDFAVFAIITSVIGPLAVFCTGRYQLAIFLPQDERDANGLINLSLYLSLTFSFLTLVILFFFYHHIGNILNLDELSYLLFAVPISLFSLAVSQVYTCYYNRIMRYKLISLGIIIQASATVFIQLLFGYYGFNKSGLVYGYVLGNLLAGIYFIYFGPSLISKMTDLVNLAKQYKKYPMVSTWSALLDSMALQIPIWLMTKNYSAEFLGAFSFSFKVINVPLGIISGSIAQILHKKVADNYREKSHRTIDVLNKFLLMLTIISIPIIFICIIWGEELFSFVFGKKWAYAGKLSSILIIAFVIRFIVSPLTSVLALDRHLKKGAAWQVLYFISTSITLYFASQFEFQMFIKIFVFHEIILYLIYLSLVYYSAFKDRSNA